MSSCRATNAKPLTSRQREALDILVVTTDRGRQATLREIGDAMRISSTQGVSDHLAALAAKGYIRLDPDARTRSVTILFDSRGRCYECPVDKLQALVEALGCETYREALAVARGRRVA